MKRLALLLVALALLWTGCTTGGDAARAREREWCKAWTNGYVAAKVQMSFSPPYQNEYEGGVETCLAMQLWDQPPPIIGPINPDITR